MNCCDDCAENLHMYGNGFGGLLPSGFLYRRGMRGLGQVGIPAGAKIRVGFRYSCPFCIDIFGGDSSAPTVGEVTTKVAACLQTTGAFYYATVQVSQGSIYQDYATISAQTRRDFADGPSLVGFIRSTLNSCYPAFANLIDDNDPVAIDELPATIQPPTTTPIAPGQTVGGGSAPSFGQQISNLLGSGAIGGAGTTTLLLLVVGAVVLAKALK